YAANGLRICGSLPQVVSAHEHTCRTHRRIRRAGKRSSGLKDSPLILSFLAPLLPLFALRITRLPRLASARLLSFPNRTSTYLPSSPGPIFQPSPRPFLNILPCEMHL